MKATQEIVEIKGRQNYLEIRLDGQSDFDLLQQVVIEKLEAGGRFFIGSQSVQVIGILEEGQKKQLQEILQKQFSFEEVMFQEKVEQLKPTQPEITKKPKIKSMLPPKMEQGALSMLPHQEGASIFINNTVRNGQRIAYDGHIIVQGDVNRGGELVATGNIIVMGALRGRAHAGSAGNTKAYVSALELSPQQLRIAQVLAIPSEGEVASAVPETAFVLQESIVISPLVKTKKKKKSFWKQ